MTQIELSTGTLLVVALPEDATDIMVTGYENGEGSLVFSSKIQDPYKVGGDILFLPKGDFQLLGHPSEISGEVWGKVVGSCICPICNGDGWMTGTDYEMQCCGMPTHYGSCCGNGVPIEVGTQIQCEFCEATGNIQSALSLIAAHNIKESDVLLFKAKNS